MKLLLVVWWLWPVVWAETLSFTSAEKQPDPTSASISDTVVVLLPVPPAAADMPASATGNGPSARPAEPELPAEFRMESAFYLQPRIGSWTLLEAKTLLGKPLHQRPSFGDQGLISGQIYAFVDPTKRYRQLELSFDRDSGVLEEIFAYPWEMSWQDCRRLWGPNASAAKAAKGRKFYSYTERRLDVLVDGAGRVISLGLY